MLQINIWKRSKLQINNGELRVFELFKTCTISYIARACDTCNNVPVSTAWFSCENIIPYHHTKAAELNVILSHYQTFWFSSIISITTLARYEITNEYHRYIRILKTFNYSRNRYFEQNHIQIQPYTHPIILSDILMC